MYYGGIDVNVQNDTVDVTWQLDAFLDNEDDRPLSYYMWSISKCCQYVTSLRKFYHLFGQNSHLVVNLI